MLPPRLLVLLLAGLSWCPSVTAAETIRLRADQWLPFNGEPGSPTPGYGIEIAREIFAEHDVALDYQTLGWGEALKAVAGGEIDAVIGANRTEAEGLVVPQEPVGEPRVALYVLAENPWRYENLASLRKIRLGVIADYKYWDAFDAYVEKQTAPRVVRFEGEAPLRDGVAKLLAGELDVFAESAPVFAWHIKAEGIPAAKFKAAYIHESDPVFIAFSPKNSRAAQYAAWLDEGIRRLRATGRLKDILARYGQLDWKR